MPASTNKRIFYATHQVGLKADGETGNFTAVKGVQSVGETANFNLEQLFQLGELKIYENAEEIPDVEITMNKVLDGHPLIYHLATREASTPTLIGRSNEKCIVGLSIFGDTDEYATGTPEAVVQSTGAYVSSISYNFSLDDFSNEDVTLVANDRTWLNDPRATNPNFPTPSFDGAFDGTGAPVEKANRREDVMFEYDSANGLDVNSMVADSDTTILPPEIQGISNSGTNEKSNGQDFDTHVSSISVSTDLGRENINELGRKGPYHRTVTFPVEVTCEVGITSTEGDGVSLMEDGIYKTSTDQCATGGNLKDRTIRIATCEGTRIYLGTKNRLSSVNYTGGDSGGGNVEVSYTFTTFNDFTVMHSGDPNTNFTWANRDTYLRDV